MANEEIIALNGLMELLDMRHANHANIALIQKYYATDPPRPRNFREYWRV